MPRKSRKNRALVDAVAQARMDRANHLRRRKPQTRRTHMFGELRGEISGIVAQMA
jgi:hypothetical protein